MAPEQAAEGQHSRSKGGSEGQGASGGHKESVQCRGGISGRAGVAQMGGKTLTGVPRTGRSGNSPRLNPGRPPAGRSHRRTIARDPWTRFHATCSLPCTVALVNRPVQLECPAVSSRSPECSGQVRGLAARSFLGVSEGCLRDNLPVTDDAQGPSDQGVPRAVLQHSVQGSEPRPWAPVQQPHPAAGAGGIQAPGHTGQARTHLLGNDPGPDLRPGAPFPPWLPLGSPPAMGWRTGLCILTPGTAQG